MKILKDVFKMIIIKKKKVILLQIKIKLIIAKVVWVLCQITLILPAEIY